MCKNRLRNDRKIFKIPSLQFQHGISNFRIFCCDFPIFASENFKKKSLIFYPYTFYTTLEKISKKGKYTTRYWQLLLTYFQSKREKKKQFSKKQIPPELPSSICLRIFLPVAVKQRKFSLSVSISNCRSWKNNKNQDTRPTMFPLTILKNFN